MSTFFLLLFYKPLHSLHERTEIQTKQIRYRAYEARNGGSGGPGRSGSQGSARNCFQCEAVECHRSYGLCKRIARVRKGNQPDIPAMCQMWRMGFHVGKRRPIQSLREYASAPALRELQGAMKERDIRCYRRPSAISVRRRYLLRKRKRWRLRYIRTYLFRSTWSA